ncbi:FAS1 domain-containing protein [Xylaria cubensis]|nr:FAS1 domain-containing protein [Xylaria cubensis]
MRYTNLLPLAVALASAVVIPDDATAQDLGLEVENQAEKAGKTTAEWWDTLRSTAQEHGAQIKKPIDETISSWWEPLRSKIDETLETLDHAEKNVEEVVDALLDDDEDSPIIFGANELDHKPGHGRHGHHGRQHTPSNYTLYQAISESNYTKKFVALVNDFPDIVDLLNSTDSNVTVFVPVDSAFDKIPEHGHKPPKEFVEKILQYHILPGFYPARNVVDSHTLPTALKSPALADRPQRLRVSVSFFRLKINFYAHAFKLDYLAKNGVAHAVDSILVPPPPARRLISLFPTKFSTLELAAEKTGLLPHHERHHHDKDGKDSAPHHHQGHNTTGLTIFAPTNFAFRKLGPAANAFLFNTEKGLGFLRALLKYHIVVNETMYSDAYYGVKGGVEEHIIPASAAAVVDDDDLAADEVQNGHFHIDLPTLLEDKSLSIDIARWRRFINIRINGYQNVAIQDGNCLDGVVHVVNSVLIPPREHKGEGAWTEEDGEISVEELVERLQPYVEGEEKETTAPAEKDLAWGEL